MKSSNDIKKIAKETINTELIAISRLEDRINDDFVEIINLILCSKGRLILSGIGKSANIARKLVSTFNSIGQPSIFLHASDAIHGDLGNIQPNDLVMCISNSGNTPEIKSLVPYIKNMGNKIIALTGNVRSFLAKESDFVLDVSVEKEACPYNLAPTSSTTAQLVMGDAMAISILSCKNFSQKDFARFHPGGVIGRRLHLTLSDVLLDNSNPIVDEVASINEVILEISEKRLGATAVFNNNTLKGIITDGDLRRMLESGNSLTNFKAKDIMNRNPKKISVNSMVMDAWQIMEENNISQIIVIDNDSYIGILHIHEILKLGIL